VYRFINRICHANNIFLCADHIRGTDNVLSDLVSRNMEQEFIQLMSASKGERTMQGCGQQRQANVRATIEGKYNV